MYRGRRVPWGPGGLLKPPLWSLANIKCDAANITCGAAVILRAQPIFKATKYFVIVKQTDTGALFSGH